jgi:hypothetical protein
MKKGMDMGDGIFAALFCFFLVLIGAVLGSSVREGGWRSDCEKLQLHVAGDGRIFECKERK